MKIAFVAIATALTLFAASASAGSGSSGATSAALQQSKPRDIAYSPVYYRNCKWGVRATPQKQRSTNVYWFEEVRTMRYTTSTGSDFARMQTEALPILNAEAKKLQARMKAAMPEALNMFCGYTVQWGHTLRKIDKRTISDAAFQQAVLDAAVERHTKDIAFRKDQAKRINAKEYGTLMDVRTAEDPR